MNTTRLALLACALLCASAHAQEPNSAASGFAALDANKDRMLSRAEAAADKDLTRVFSKVDLNKDGKLNEDEYLKGVSLYQREKTSQFASDGTVTAKVKTAFLKASGLPSTAISVETSKGQVQLSGFVDNKAQVAQAGKIAAEISGVKSVRNKLQVK